MDLPDQHCSTESCTDQELYTVAGISIHTCHWTLAAIRQNIFYPVMCTSLMYVFTCPILYSYDNLIHIMESRQSHDSETWITFSVFFYMSLI